MIDRPRERIMPKTALHQFGPSPVGAAADAPGMCTRARQVLVRGFENLGGAQADRSTETAR